MFKISLRIRLYFVYSGYLYSHLRKIFEYQNHVSYYYIKEGFKKMWNSEMWTWYLVNILVIKSV